MSKFHRPPSGRRQPRTTAKAIALGLTLAGKVARGEQHAVLMPVRLPLENRDGYRKRFAPEQRLAVRGYVGGSTLAHLIVTDAERIQLGHVDYGLVRELGYIRLDAFQLAWIREHDEPWWRGVQERLEGQPPTDETFDEFMERFQRRHAHREMWVIRFALDRTETPRMLAQAGRDRGSHYIGSDGRWHYRPGAEDAEADRGYTSVDALSLRDVGRALDDEAWERHVGKAARDREVRRQAMLAQDRAALDTGQRASYARHAASTKGLDMRSEFRLYDRLVRLERAGEALRQLELIESRVFPQRRAA